MKTFLVLCLVATFSLASASKVKFNATEIESSLGASISPFETNKAHRILDLMKKHFDLSVKYLYTSTSYGGQTLQRPGMAKELKEQSDSHWEDGIAVLKKFLKRGGDVAKIDKYFNVEFTNTHQSVVSSPETSYLATLKDLLKDSKTCGIDLNILRKESRAIDGDWTHYLDEKLEEEAGRTREMAGHVTNLSKMLGSGLALHFFDSNI